jgi:hypothetical protein
VQKISSGITLVIYSYKYTQSLDLVQDLLLSVCKIRNVLVVFIFLLHDLIELYKKIAVLSVQFLFTVVNN